MFDDDDSRSGSTRSFERKGNPDAPLLPDLQTTYRPSRHEEGWLLESLGDFFADDVLSDLLFPVRGGKEATVACCRGGPALDGRLVAAKIYRPRKYRELSNDAIYREGRGLLGHRGHRERARDQRLSRAVRKGSRTGKEATHVSWVMHEFTTLQELYHAGGAVPEPHLMLWQGRVVMIDLPQVCDVHANPHAVGLFLRDIDRVCRFFERELDPRRVADEMWDRVFDTEDGVPDTPFAMLPTASDN